MQKARLRYLLGSRHCTRNSSIPLRFLYLGRVCANSPSNVSPCSRNTSTVRINPCPSPKTCPRLIFTRCSRASAIDLLVELVRRRHSASSCPVSRAAWLHCISASTAHRAPAPPSDFPTLLDSKAPDSRFRWTARSSHFATGSLARSEPPRFRILSGSGRLELVSKPGPRRRSERHASSRRHARSCDTVTASGLSTLRLHVSHNPLTGGFWNQLLG